MDSVEATTRIIEAYLQSSNNTALRNGSLLKSEAKDIAEAFKTICAAIEGASNAPGS